MSCVAEIEQAIARFSPGEFGELERQVEDDAHNGRLRAAYERLKAVDSV